MLQCEGKSRVKVRLCWGEPTGDSVEFVYVLRHFAPTTCGVCMRLIIGLVFLVFASLPSSAAEPLASVPYRIDYNGWLTVKVMVNGLGPYDFIIDTGATQSLVFQNLADQQDFMATGGAPQTVLGLASQGAFPPHLVGELDVGGARLGGLITVILPDWEIEDRPQGILGLDFLRQYICVFDAKAGELRFYANNDPPTEEVRRWKRAALKADNFGLEINYLYTVEARVNSRRVTFLLDLGASGTVINRSAVASVIKSGITVRVRPSGGDARDRITDALEKSEAATTIIVNRFQVGRNYWYRQKFLIHNAPIFRELGVHNKPFGLLGADLLHDRSFMLDFEGEELRIGPRRR